jgi:TPP-dependent pyruvate/acetoin dehydrogenase alpha subunit
VHSHQRDRQAVPDICLRAQSYGIPAERIEHHDVLEIHERVGSAVKKLRDGVPGPFFFECMTYRWMEHVGPNRDYQAGYRSDSEAAPWFESDQVERIGAMLNLEARQKIESDVETGIREAFEFAEQSPFPADEELYTDMCEA